MSKRKQCRHLYQCHWCGQRRPDDAPVRSVVPPTARDWHDDGAPIPLPPKLEAEFINKLARRVARLEDRTPDAGWADLINVELTDLSTCVNELTRRVNNLTTRVDFLSDVTTGNVRLDAAAQPPPPPPPPPQWRKAKSTIKVPPLHEVDPRSSGGDEPPDHGSPAGLFS
jgi:hypothetical protein